MNKILIVVGLCGFLFGCAALKQAGNDYETGANTPLAVNEVAPSTTAAAIGGTVSSLPIPLAVPIGSAVTFIAGIFLTWQRGISIRKNNGLVPATAATNSNVVNGLVQDAANVAAGMFTVASTTAPTTTGSVFQRVWKTALATILGGATLASTEPAFASFLGAHPVVSGLLVGVPSVISGIEKALSSVQPVATVLPTSA